MYFLNLYSKVLKKVECTIKKPVIGGFHHAIGVWQALRRPGNQGSLKCFIFVARNY